MKSKILSLAILMLAVLTSNAQDNRKFQKYVAGSLSLSNGDNL